MKNTVSKWTIIITLIGLISDMLGVVDMPKKCNTFIFVLFILAITFGIISYLWEQLKLQAIFHNIDALRKLGIFKIHTKGRAGSELFKSKIANAKEVRIIVVSGDNLIKLIKDPIVKILSENKAEIKLLLATPNSEFINDIETVESEFRKGQISNEIENVLRFRKEYLKEAKDKSKVIGTFEYRHYNTHLRNSLIIVDDEWAWLTVNLPPKRAVQNMSMELRKEKDDSLIRTAMLHFDTVWELCPKINIK